MAISRRRFLQHGALAAAACATSPFSAFASQHPIGNSQPDGLSASRSFSGGAWQDHAAALEGITRDMFANAVGANFKVLSASGDSPVWLTLHAVEDLPQLALANPASFAVRNRLAAAPAPISNGFVLRFGSSTPLSQDSYLFQHDALGSFALLLVPEAGGQTFSATVNRLDAAVVIAIPVHAAITGNNQAAQAIGIAAIGQTAAPATGDLISVETSAVRRAKTQE